MNNGREDVGVGLDRFIIETKGEFSGWRTWPRDMLDFRCGPFYFRGEVDGRVRCAFRVKREHLNGMDSADSGCLMKLAEFSLFAFASTDLGAAPASTVSFYAEFIEQARQGDLVEAEAYIAGSGRSLTFLKGVLRCNGRPLISYSGLIKRMPSSESSAQ